MWESKSPPLSILLVFKRWNASRWKRQDKYKDGNLTTTTSKETKSRNCLLSLATKSTNLIFHVHCHGSDFKVCEKLEKRDRLNQEHISCKMSYSVGGPSIDLESLTQYRLSCKCIQHFQTVFNFPCSLSISKKCTRSTFFLSCECSTRKEEEEEASSMKLKHKRRRQKYNF